MLLLSDTHGAVDPVILALAEKCDAIVHAGDIGSRDVLKALHAATGLVYAVRGNNDTPAKWPRPDRAAVQRLPEELLLQLPGGLLAVAHGDRVQPAAKRHAGLRRCYPLARAVVYGHTHRLTCDGGSRPWVLNPGAAGKTRTFGGPSCMLLDASEGCWSVRAMRVRDDRPTEESCIRLLL